MSAFLCSSKGFLKGEAHLRNAVNYFKWCLRVLKIRWRTFSDFKEWNIFFYRMFLPQMLLETFCLGCSIITMYQKKILCNGKQSVMLLQLQAKASIKWYKRHHIVQAKGLFLFVIIICMIKYMMLVSLKVIYFLYFNYYYYCFINTYKDHKKSSSSFFFFYYQLPHP